MNLRVINIGHNIDLGWLLGLPSQIKCTRCGKITKTPFDEYDIDCGEPQAHNSIMTLDVTCEHCEKEIEYQVKIIDKVYDY